MAHVGPCEADKREAIWHSAEMQDLLGRVWGKLPLEDGVLTERGYKSVYRHLYWRCVPEGTQVCGRKDRRTMACSTCGMQRRGVQRRGT